jgi:peptidoglycan lytic transglycosylase
MLTANSTVAAKTQFGVASWYGPEFQGLPTASGQPFNMQGMTCAHRELPLGTHVRVTNLLNGRNLVLEVTDRGPFVGKRVLDVSMAAAKRLGFMGQGVTPVRIQVLTYPYPQHPLISQDNPQAFMPPTN